jgi:hypothetical protein
MRLRGQDRHRLLTGAAAIAVAVALAIVLFLVARSVNRPPVIVRVDTQPATVTRDGAASIKVRAEDPDADRLAYEYKADYGRVVAEAGRPYEARYAPSAEGPIHDLVTVTVTDARGLASTVSTLITIEGPPPTPEPTEEPTPEPTEMPAATWTPFPTKTPKPTRTPLTPKPVTPTPTPGAPRENHPPVLQEGSTISELGTNPIVLVATGHEPDGEPVTFSWDPGPCLQLNNPTQFEAEVKLIGQCTYAVAILTWTDPHGETASCQWTIHR